ncbi:hypothetical protein TNCV_4052211 [Trichonephila clavipes]|nr:hypothetical protein TNCV_4052211 [Trichonephila clavipes]
MERFTNTQQADLDLIYELAEGNARAEEGLYCIRSPQRNASDHRMLTKLYHNLSEYGSLRDNRHTDGGLRVTRTPSREQQRTSYC